MSREELLKIAKPILFNTEMVRAILDGRKTQMRRAIELPKDFNVEGFGTATDDELSVIEARFDDYDTDETIFIKPKYKKGDILFCDTFTLGSEHARIFLRVTDVRVERLQDISIEDILAEGFDKGRLTENYGDKELIDKCLEWWIKLWDSTTKDGFKWGDNPCVFVYEFEKMEV